MKVVLSIVYIAAIIWALYDIAKGTMERNRKLMWMLGVVMVPFLGIILYVLVARRGN